MEAGDTDLNDTCLKDAKRKQLGVRASAQKEIEQIDNALALTDDMTARIDAVSAAGRRYRNRVVEKESEKMKVLISFIIAALVFAAIVGWGLYVTSIKICNFCAQPITETEVVEDIWAADSTPKPHLIQHMLTNAEACEFAVNEEATATDKPVIMSGEIPFPLTDEQIYEWYGNLQTWVEAIKKEVKYPRNGKFGDIECESFRDK